MALSVTASGEGQSAVTRTRTRSDVSLITDDGVCSQAAQAFLSSLGHAGDPIRPVWVLKVGPDRYFVADGFRKSSGRYIAMIFDANFVQRRTLLTG